MLASRYDRVCVSTGETNTTSSPALRIGGFRIVDRYLDYVQ